MLNTIEKLTDPDFDLYMKVESNYFFTNTPTLPMPNICDYNGDWEEKRSLGPTTIWHPSNDKLTGTENYGNIDSKFCPPIVSPVKSCVDSSDTTDINRFALVEGDCVDATNPGLIP